MGVRYRPEIDGLRALAVGAVILFHADFPGFAGGFVGVDIFFVISGFLITSIIHDQWSDGRFSYALFLERRIRRILPALILVMAVSVPIAYRLMLPDPLENFGQSLVATAASANNILLWLTSGYWNPASEFKPLLHTWSLGVEEQFYLLYPVVLVAALVVPPKPRLGLMLAVAVLSLGSMVLVARSHPNAAFYLLPFRAWQLLVGAMAAQAVRDFGVAPRPGPAALGALLMLAAILGGPLAGDWAIALMLVACTGAALFLVFAREGSWAARPFTIRPVVYTGLISYGFYLWHQPVFAFTRIAMFEPPGLQHYLAGISVAFALSVLTHRYVELPFRDRDATARATVFGAVGVGMAGLLAVGFAMNATAGFPSRMQTASGEPLRAGATIAYNERVRTRLARDFEAAPPASVRVAILGNSFARDFANVLLEANPGKDTYLVYRADIAACSRDRIAREMDLLRSADAVIFASGSYWPDCIRDLGHRVAAAGEFPETWFVGPKHFGANLNPLVRLSPAERAAVRLRIPEEVVRRNDQQAEWLGARYVDLLSILSEDNRRIRVADANGTLLTTDRIHLSQAGAAFLAERLPEFAPRLHALVTAASVPGE